VGGRKSWGVGWFFTRGGKILGWGWRKNWGGSIKKSGDGFTFVKVGSYI
jgi:hypothetical protein